MIRIILYALIISLVACQPNGQKESNREEKPAITSHHSDLLTKIFEAHGGYNKWSNMKSLSYTKGDETTVVNLQNRKIRLESPTQTIGYDGENVWIAPDTIDASRARFYHNLYFYFYAMPFVVGDPGVFYEDLEPMEINGKKYNGVKVSYDNGIGDSPKDNYILWVDPKTNLMEWLMYTVTFRSGEASEKYSLIRYNDWAEVSGLILPTKLDWYNYKDSVVGELRNEAVFENVEVTMLAPNDTLFIAPENAAITPPPLAN